MELEAFINKKKDFYNAILSFIDSESESEDEFRTITKFIDDQEIIQNEEIIREMFSLLYAIGSNHHRTPYFFDRLGMIFEQLRKKRLPIIHKEIYQIYYYINGFPFFY